MIDNLARSGGVPAAAPVGMVDEVNALKSQVELLQATVRSLEDRLNRLEGKTAPKPANEAPPAGAAAPAPADPFRRLELKLAPPDKPALPTPPAVP